MNPGLAVSRSLNVLRGEFYFQGGKTHLNPVRCNLKDGEQQAQLLFLVSS
jgi:hypothetical protein